MINLLKRFEEDNLDNPFVNPETNDDDGTDNLEQRLAGINLGESYLAELPRARSIGHSQKVPPRIVYGLR
jgi:hypothetical protein